MSATRPPAFDDQFTTPIEASRRGAHRARPKPVSAGLPVLAGIAVVLLVVGGVYAVVTGGPNNSSPNANVAAGQTQEPGASASPGAADSAPTATKKAKAEDPKPSATSESTSEVDRGVTLVVLNSVSVQGLAKRVKTTLESSGWTVSRTDNSINKNLPATKVYYGKKSLRPTAEAMVKDLGYGEVAKDSTVAKTGLIVVLGQDAAS
jgi:LytR cell envelope-related transcriptional attenuator